MTFRLRAILAFFVVVVNGCVLVVDKVAQDIARYPALAPMYARSFPIGAAVEPWQLETKEGKLLAWHFNSVVAENAMKTTRLQPAEGHFDFAAADTIVGFAERRGMKVRGHTLLWHEETPDWFWRGADGRPATREAVLERLRRHVHAVIGRYRGRVYAWDVVNEVVDPAAPGCLRNDRWLQVVGPDYVEWAFRYAHEADPSARLLINDFDTTDPGKRACLLKVVRNLLDRGVPVHGVGHQMHIDLDKPSAQQVDETLSLFAALGLENQITELDMSVGAPSAPAPGDAPSAPALGDGTQLLARQAARYEELFRVFLAHADVKAVTFWGISDAHTWLNAKRSPGSADQPLLFDAHQEPKPAYWGVASAAR